MDAPKLAPEQDKSQLTKKFKEQLRARLLEEEQSTPEPEEEAPAQLLEQALITPPAREHALPTFTVGGGFRVAARSDRVVVTTSRIEGLARINRLEVGADPGDSIGWIQTIFHVHLQADYYTAEGVYVESHISESNSPMIDGDGGEMWYNVPAQFGADPVIGQLFDDSPQSFALLTSPKGGRLARFAASWEFGCWLATRTPGGRVKFLYHQDWSASFHAEYRGGEATLSSEDLSLGDSGPGVGSLVPLMSGRNASDFLADPGLWTDAGGERLDMNGVDLT
jgi:hypothetical protein